MGRTILACLAAAAGILSAQQESAWSLSEQAKEAEKKGDVVRAYLLYAQSAALDPNNRGAWAHSLALRTQAILKAGAVPAARPTDEPTDDDGAEPLEPLTDADLYAARELRPPIRLQPDPAVRSFNLSGDARALWEKAAKEFGLQVIFDGEYQPLNNLRFRIEGVGPQEALAALEHATASFLVPVNPRMILVARDSIQKRQDLEPTIAVALPIPTPVGLPEAQEVARTIQQLMDIQKFGIDSARRVAVIRDRISKVIPALAVARQLLHHRPEILFEVEFLEVIENSLLDYGLNLQSSFPIVWLSRIWNSTPSYPQGFANFGVFGGGMTRFGIGIVGAESFARFSEGSTRTLIHKEMRTSDGLAASLHIGDKYPILTAGYFGQTSGSGEVYTPPPTFNFEDLGVVLKLTPKVHGYDEVSLEVDAEFKVLTGQVTNGIPVIASRKMLSRMRVRNGEWAVIAGLTRASEARTIAGIAGLSNLPALGALFRQNSRRRESGQTLFLIKPRLLTPPLSEIETPPLWTGSETRPRFAM